MKETGFVQAMMAAGDATINFKSKNSGKARYVVGTMDFDNKYIKTKRKPEFKAEDGILVFCWDSDGFKVIDPEKVTSVVPLADTLRNTSP